MNFAEIESRLAGMADVHLNHGSHTSLESGACAMELVSYLANEPWSDSPECTSPVITAFVRNWNDSLPNDAERDRLLKPLLPLLIGTRASKAIEEKRSYMALDWLVRECAPAFCDLMPALNEITAQVRAFSPITDLPSAKKAGPIVRKMSDQSAAARAAAWAAARAAAWAAAGDAARAAAGDAGKQRLAPTVDQLQQSAIRLVIRMVEAQ